MDRYLPWFIILGVTYLAISAFRNPKAEPTPSDRRNMAFAVVPSVLIPVAVVCFSICVERLIQLVGFLTPSDLL
jgi:hypothetical protein